MRKKYHLLDHKWQKIGFALFITTIVLFLVYLLKTVFTFSPNHVFGIADNYKLDLFNAIIQGPVALLTLLSSVAFALMALSQEKQEDDTCATSPKEV